MDRQLAARGRDALAAGARGGPLGQVPLRARRRRRDVLVALAVSRAGRPSTATPAATGSATRSSKPRSMGSRPAGRSSATPRRPSSSGRSSSPTRRAARAGSSSWAFSSGACGVSPSPRREFARLFLETWHDPARPRRLRPQPHVGRAVAALGPLEHELPVRQRLRGDGAAERRAGRQGRVPRTLRRLRRRPPRCDRTTGRRSSAATRTRSRPCAARIELAARRHARRSVSSSRPRGSAEEAADLARRFASVGAMDASLAAVHAGWRDRLAAHRMETPDAALDAIANDWVRYQAISARLWGALRLLPAERRLRVPRSAPGLAGLADHRPAALPRADPPPRRRTSSPTAPSITGGIR